MARDQTDVSPYRLSLLVPLEVRDAEPAEGGGPPQPAGPMIGKEAPAEVRRDAFRILDSLRFDPGVTPDWQAAG